VAPKREKLPSITGTFLRALRGRHTEKRREMKPGNLWGGKPLGGDYEEKKKKRMEKGEINRSGKMCDSRCRGSPRDAEEEACTNGIADIW